MVVILLSLQKRENCLVFLPFFSPSSIVVEDIFLAYDLSKNLKGFTFLCAKNRRFFAHKKVIV